MKRSRLEALITGASMLTMAVFAGGVWAASPTQADMDLCNQKAAEAAQAAKGSQTAAAQQPGAPGSNRTGGRITDSTAPGTSSSAGAAQPGTTTNPTGGRITDSSQPGMGQMTTGMAPAGQNDSVYRQAYSVCLMQRGQK